MKRLTMATVSVIIPAYNRADVIGRAIKSMLNQIYQNFEIIIVDDGSTDEVEKVVESFQDDRIKYIKLGKNQGAANARNIGVQAARSEYIAFLDSDDEWLPHKLEVQMKIFDGLDPQYGVVYSGGWIIQGNAKRYIPYRSQKPRSGDIRRVILRTGLVCTSSAIVRKKCFEKVGLFDTRMQCIEDWELWILIAKDYYFYYIEQPLWIYHITPCSRSSNTLAILSGLERIYKKHYQDIHKYPDIESKYLYWIGSLLCRRGEVKKGREFLFRSLKVNPWRAERLISLGISFVSSNLYNKLKDFEDKFKAKFR